MSLHFRDFTKAGARAPAKAAGRLNDGATLTFTAADRRAMLSRLQSIDLGPEQMKTLHALGTEARATGKIEIDNSFLKALDFDLSDIAPDDSDDPGYTSYMTGVELAIGAATVFALGLALGALIEDALDDPDADNSVTNVTQNGDGKTIVNNNNGDGE